MKFLGYRLKELFPKAVQTINLFDHDHLPIPKITIDNAKALSRRICAVLRRASESSTPNEVRAILQAGADVNDTDNDGNTALMTAAKNNRLDTAEVLVAHNADVHAINHQGQKALHIAQASYTLTLWFGYHEAPRTIAYLQHAMQNVHLEECKN